MAIFDNARTSAAGAIRVHSVEPPCSTDGKTIPEYLQQQSSGPVRTRFQTASEHIEKEKSSWFVSLKYVDLIKQTQEDLML